MFLGIELRYYVLCGIGAFVLFFKFAKTGQSVFDVIKYLNPSWSDRFLGRFSEAIVFIFLGALIGTIMTQPTNEQQAITAGLGWTGLLGKVN